jgi:hypothetical protein
MAVNQTTDNGNGTSTTRFSVDHQYGVVALTVNQSSQGAIQIEGVLRLNRTRFLAGDGLLECLALEDRFHPFQSLLGYPAANFINPDDILWPAPV